MSKASWLRAVWLRRGTQIAFLIAFVALVVAARPTPGEPPPAWLGVWFDLDPLIALTAALASWDLAVASLLALVTVALTVVLGRVFCGWACPLGTVHAIASWFFRPKRQRPPSPRWSRWQLSKYVVLLALVAMALFGVQWLVLLDPLVILYRTTATALLPAGQTLVEDASTAVYQADPHWGEWHLTGMTEPAYEFARDRFFVTPRQAFLGATLIALFFLATVALNAWRPRFWCRYVCPLGGLLGLLAWRPWLRREVDSAACTECDLCGLTCHGAAASAPGSQWRPQECFGCLNCTASCTPTGLRFTLKPPWQRADEQESVDLTRRHWLGGAALGVGGLLALRVTPQARGTEFHPQLIRPPGSRAEHDFLARCTACGLCMKICPTGGLQPATHEAGLLGLWTPVLVPRIGYCQYDCTRCGEVCPTQAIAPLPLEEKQQTRIGLAAFDTSRCLPYAYDRNCAVCEEHCPVPEKAIFFKEVEVVGRDGQPKTLLQPHVDPDLCIGCGICENVCPFQDRPAVRVTSANESRHEDNQPILPAFGGYGGHGS